MFIFYKTIDCQDKSKHLNTVESAYWDTLGGGLFVCPN